MSNLLWTQLEANNLLREHGLYDLGWRFVWDNARSRGGECRHTQREISMSKYLVPMWSDDQVKQTLIHEVSHALVGPGNGHGPVWAAQMRKLGADPKRTHDHQIVKGRYVAICDHCGGKEIARAHRRGKAMKSGKQLHRACMKPIRWVDTQAVGA